MLQRVLKSRYIDIWFTGTSAPVQELYCLALFARNQRLSSATVAARPSQRTRRETKTTVALKNMNARNEWIATPIQPGRRRWVSALHHIQIASRTQMTVNA